jgi:hypothetical protein
MEQISAFSHPFITGHAHARRSSRQSSSTALIVRPGSQTLLAQIVEHEVTILAAVVMELEEQL